jgi:hypothetical protein
MVPGHLDGVDVILFVPITWGALLRRTAQHGREANAREAPNSSALARIANLRGAAVRPANYRGSFEHEYRLDNIAA